MASRLEDPDHVEDLGGIGPISSDGRRSSSRQFRPRNRYVAPGLVALVGEVRREQRVEVAARLERRAEQPEARLLERLAALAVVARLAGGDEVLPRVAAATMARHDVVERQVVRLAAAVLAACGGRGRRSRAGSA